MKKNRLIDADIAAGRNRPTVACAIALESTGADFNRATGQRANRATRQVRATILNRDVVESQRGTRIEQDRLAISVDHATTTQRKVVELNARLAAERFRVACQVLSV